MRMEQDRRDNLSLTSKPIFMSNKPTTLREEFEKKFPLESAGCDGCHTSQKYQIEVMNWWLSKFHSHSTELISKIEGMKCEPATGHPARFNYEPEWYIGFNQALDQVISLINQEK